MIICPPYIYQSLGEHIFSRETFTERLINIGRTDIVVFHSCLHGRDHDFYAQVTLCNLLSLVFIDCIIIYVSRYFNFSLQYRLLGSRNCSMLHLCRVTD